MTDVSAEHPRALGLRQMLVKMALSAAFRAGWHAGIKQWIKVGSPGLDHDTMLKEALAQYMQQYEDADLTPKR